MIASTQHIFLLHQVLLERYKAKVRSEIKKFKKPKVFIDYVYENLEDYS